MKKKLVILMLLAALTASQLTACGLSSDIDMENLVAQILQKSDDDDADDEDEDDSEDEDRDDDEEDESEEEPDEDSEEDDDEKDSRQKPYEVLSIIREYGPDGTPNAEFDGFGYELCKDIEELYEDGSIVIDRSNVKSAKAQQEQSIAIDYLVVIDLDKEGTEKFAEATKEASVDRECMFIYANGEIVSAPIVQSAIMDGRFVINGLSSFEDAEELRDSLLAR